MTGLAFTRRGAGAPLVLLHGLGSSRRAWDPVVPALAERFDVLAVDLPGFGDSKPFPPQLEPHPAALAAAVDGLLEDLGIDAPHLVGNSLGGWVALELAHTKAGGFPDAALPGRAVARQHTSLQPGHAASLEMACPARPPAVAADVFQGGPHPGPRADARPTLENERRPGTHHHLGHGQQPGFRRHVRGNPRSPLPGRAEDRRAGHPRVRLP